MEISNAKGLLLATIGVATVSTYLASSAGLIEVSPILDRLLVFSIGPVAILAVIRISERLERFGKAVWRKIATAYLVIAFSLFTLMIVVQQSVLARYNEMGVTESATASGLPGAFQLVNQVQLGIDVCFDIFYCLGIVLLSHVLSAARPFGRIIAVFGQVSAFGLLAMNVFSFPTPPAEAGLVDLGPLTGIWWILLIVYMGRLRREAGEFDAGRTENRE